MYYAGQVGRRLPVPIFQAIEDLTIFAILLLVERWLRSSAPRPTLAGAGEGEAAVQAPPPPAGIVIGVGMVLWGIERFFDEHLWLGEDGHLGSLLVQIAGVALAVSGVVLLITRIGPFRRWRNGETIDKDAVAVSIDSTDAEVADADSLPVASTPGPPGPAGLAISEGD
jgi:hypothetical protein